MGVNVNQMDFYRDTQILKYILGRMGENKSYMSKTKIGYFADGKWSHETLTKLVTDDSIDVIFICLRKDNPDLVLEKMAEDYKIQIFKNQDINSDEFFKEIEGFKIDIK